MPSWTLNWAFESFWAVAAFPRSALGFSPDSARIDQDMQENPWKWVWAEIWPLAYVWKWRGGGTPIGGPLYGDPGKMAYVFYFGVGSICRNGVRNGISYVCAYTLFHKFFNVDFIFITDDIQEFLESGCI